MDEGRRPAAHLRRLIAELRDEAVVVSKLGGDVSDAASRAKQNPDAPSLSLLAVRMHRYYTAIESAVLRIERALGSEPTGGDSHLELIVGAAREIEGVRPAILPRATIPALRELLRFRHFFRHAYAVELDAQKLFVVSARVEEVRTGVDAAVEEFTAFLEKAAVALESPAR